MTTILDTIAAHARERVARAKELAGPAELRERALALGPGGGAAFEAALARPGLSVIAEVKKASPSKGVIDPVFDYMAAARAYEAAGADCVSCLTEPRWFLGSDAVFGEIRAAIAAPMIRKDYPDLIYRSRQEKFDAIVDAIVELHQREQPVLVGT
ncbi:MAG: hypothetical protein HUK26_05110, partial [Duodenibacillus sp.]|nr:hypothetical protein [Duodenibacillus sp.]